MAIGQYNLTAIVSELMIEMGQSQNNQQARMYQLGMACLREQNMDLSGFPKIVSLVPNANDTVDLPSDYLNYTRIAICGPDGVLHSLGRNDNLCLDKNYTACGVPSNQNNSGSLNTQATTTGVNNLNGNNGLQNTFWAAVDNWDDNYRNGELMGRFFGIGGGNNANGYYRIDIPNGQILLAGGWAWTANNNGIMPTIVLEYLADIEASGNDYIVHPFLIETVKDYIFWKLIARDRNRNANEKQMAMIDYQKSERLSRIRFNSRTLENWAEAFRFGNKAAVKW